MFSNKIQRFTLMFSCAILCFTTISNTAIHAVDEAPTDSVTESFLDEQVDKLTTPSEKTKNTNLKTTNVQAVNKPAEKPKGKFASLMGRDKKTDKKVTSKVNTQVKTTTVTKKEENFAPLSLNGDSSKSSTEELTEEVKPKKLVEENKELKTITKERKKNNEKTIDAINFIQPSVNLTDEEQSKIDMALSKAEQEQLTILWRATLERNKTIHFIVQKLTPDEQNKKKNQVLSQILNTAIFLPFYALQTVAPADTSALASYVGAGLAGDLINGKARKNSDKMQLSQTEMVIMFMMIDQVAERVRGQFHDYKQERTDAALAINELEEAKQEASAALQFSTPESQFLSQIRIRQLERELKRITMRVRSNRIVLVDLSGPEAVEIVDKLIDKEVAAVIDLPPIAVNQ